MCLNRKLLFFIFFSPFIYIGCNESDFQKFDKFPKYYTLNGDKIEEEIIFSQCMIDILDSLLIFTATPNNPKCIHFYNKNTFEYISSTGIRGKGPYEISNPGHCTIDKKNGVIWYRDLGNQCIWAFNIENALRNDNYLPERKIPIPDEKFFIYFKVENDSLFSFSDTDQDNLISFFNHNGEVIDSLAIYNSIEFYKSEIPELTRTRTATYFYEKNWNTGDYIIAYRFNNLIARISGNNKKCILKAISSNDKNQIPDKNDKSQIVANECLKIGNSRIYCLYSGQASHNDKYNYPGIINIFDFNLNPVASLKLEYTAMWFEIDLQNNRIITFSPETGRIVFYKLPTDLMKEI
jgi:hypothetical protein